jgi:hypothetical protein
MKNLHQALPSILSQPTPAALVALQGALLARGPQGEAVDRALEIAGRFHSYLCELQSKITARDYSELASRLDIGAVGAVALENVLAGEGKELWQSLLLGGVGETLMIAASRQYIKAWETETALIHTCAAWFLSEALWHASSEMQPGLSPEQRWGAIQSLLAPAHDPEVPAPDKAILLGRIFQMLLLTYLAGLLPAAEAEADG